MVIGNYNGGMKTLLPNPAVLSLEKIISQTDAIALVVTTSRPQVPCPECQQLSARVHSRYQRGITDLPWGEITVRLKLQTRKFFCDNSECRQRIFCERLPDVAPPYGRQTNRVNKSLTAVGFALGGRAGERLASDLYLSSAARTLLRRIYDEPVGKAERVRILRVDDFAFHKGQRYGTILVDLEQRRALVINMGYSSGEFQGSPALSMKPVKERTVLAAVTDQISRARTSAV
jgi:transposase